MFLFLPLLEVPYGLEIKATLLDIQIPLGGRLAERQARAWSFANRV